MPDSSEHLVTRLSEEGQKTCEFFQALSPDQWDQTLYTEGACWTVRQVLAHFVASERAFHDLFTDILNGGSGAPADLDLNRYNESLVSKMASLDPEDLLSQFLEQRQETCRIVAQMTADDLQRTGRHPFLGLAPVVDMVKLIYRHNQIHIRDIRKIG